MMEWHGHHSRSRSSRPATRKQEPKPVRTLTYSKVDHGFLMTSSHGGITQSMRLVRWKDIHTVNPNSKSLNGGSIELSEEDFVTLIQDWKEFLTNDTI